MTTAGIKKAQKQSEKLNIKESKMHGLNAVASAIIFSLYALPSLSFAQTEQNNEKAEASPEVIEIIGRRNQANSEMTEETEQLMNVAGIGNDPLSAVYSLPGIVYAGGDTGSPAVRGSSPDDNAFYIDDMPAGYIFHLFGDSILMKTSFVILACILRLLVASMVMPRAA